MRAFLIGLGLSNQIQADYCNLNGESDHNQPIDSCFCPSGTDSHLENSNFEDFLHFYQHRTFL